MAVLTGKNGALRWNGANVGKVRSWSLTINRDALDSTSLGVDDRTFVQGLRGATGSADLMYDPNEGQAVAMLNSVFSDNTATIADTVGFVLDVAGGKRLTCTAFLTNVSPTVSVGAVHACTVSFQVSGPLGGGF